MITQERDVKTSISQESLIIRKWLLSGDTCVRLRTLNYMNSTAVEDTLQWTTEVHRLAVIELIEFELFYNDVRPSSWSNISYLSNLRHGLILATCQTFVKSYTSYLSNLRHRLVSDTCQTFVIVWFLLPVKSFSLSNISLLPHLCHGLILAICRTFVMV